MEVSLCAFRVFVCAAADFVFRFQVLAAAAVGCKDPVAAEAVVLGPKAATLGDALRVKGSQDSLNAFFPGRLRKSAPSTREGTEGCPIEN